MAGSLTTLGAIQTLWNADGGLATGGLNNTPLVLFDDEPQEGTALGTYFVVEGFREPERLDAMGGFKWVDSRWAFVGWFVGVAVAEAAAALVRAALNDKALSVTGRNFFEMHQEKYEVKVDQTRSTTARRVTEVRLDYWAQFSIPGTG